MKRLVVFLLALALSVSLAHAGDVQVIDPKAAFPEGPLWHGDMLYYVEYGGNTIKTWDGSKIDVFWKQDGCGPSAVAMDSKGDFLVTCYDNGTVARVSAGGETKEVYDKDDMGQGFMGPNDLAADAKGGVYFSASGPWESEPIVGKVYYIAPEGKIKCVADDLHYANGLALSSSGQTLFVAESEAGRVIRFKVADDGSLSDRRLFVRVFQVDEGSGASAYPDGMKLDTQGNMYIGQYSSGRIVVVDPEGKLVKTYEVPSPAAPNLAFGPKGEFMYIMAVDETAEAPYWGKVYQVPLK